MQLILLSWLLLLARLQIYCNSAILSLPPSLIAGAASFGKHHKRKHQLPRPSWQWQAVRAKEQRLYQTMMAVVPSNERWQMKKDVGDGNVDYIGTYRNWFGNRNSNIISNSYNNINYNENNISRVDNAASMLSQKTSATKYQKMKKKKRARKQNKNTEKHDDVDGDDDEISLQQEQRLQGQHRQKQQTQLQQQCQHEWQQHKGNLYKLRHDYEINSLLAVAAAQAQTSETDVMRQPQKEKQHRRETKLQSQSPSPAAIAPRIREIEWNEFFPWMKYWSRLCRSLGDDDGREKSTDARQEHHRLDCQRYKPWLSSIRSRQPKAAKTPVAEIAAIDIHGVTSHNFPPTEALPNASDIEDYGDNNNDGDDDRDGSDVLSLLNDEDEFRTFLHWTCLHARSRDQFRNYTEITWNNPKEETVPLVQPQSVLYAEGPRFVIVRRKPDETDVLKPSSLHQRVDPLISPRGQKYDPQMTDLSVLFHNSEIFAPNRGKRNNIKDLFKYDDIFIPNRGKKGISLNVRKGLTIHRQKRGAQSQVGASKQRHRSRWPPVRRLLKQRGLVNKEFFGIFQDTSKKGDGVLRLAMRF